MLTRTAVCSFAILSRMVELRASRRHIEDYGGSGEGRWSRRTYPLMVLLHTTVLLGTLFFGGRRRWALLLPFLAVQPLRVWILLALGRRWNARGVVPTAMVPATSGPYAFVRHPNYAVVAIELFSLPAGFGLRRLAIVASLVNACLLWLRIRDEEALLFRLPGYEEHFAGKSRFVPGVF